MREDRQDGFGLVSLLVSREQGGMSRPAFRNPPPLGVGRFNVRVVVEGTQDEKDVLKLPSALFVEQANAKAIVDQKSYCHLKGNSVKAIVPACSPTATSQVPSEDFSRLSACYSACLKVAAEAGATTIVIKPLGVGIHLTRMSETGRILPNGLWGNLFWSHTKTSAAARIAVGEVCATIPGDVTAVFIVPQEAFDDWDNAMQFPIDSGTVE